MKKTNPFYLLTSKNNSDLSQYSRDVQRPIVQPKYVQYIHRYNVYII